MSVTITVNHDRSGLFELNLANGNFATLDAALGAFDGEYCGTVDPRCLLKALQSFDLHLAVRAEQRGYVDGSLRYVCCALPLERVEQYTKVLTEIANEAERREEKVVWF